MNDDNAEKYETLLDDIEAYVNNHSLLTRNFYMKIEYKYNDEPET